MLLLLFIILEVVDIIGEPLQLPNWTLAFVIVLLCIGFILAVIFSWIFDITPEGIQKTKPETQVSNVIKQSTSRGWKISTYISGLVIVAFVVFYIIGNIKRSSDISKLEKSIAVLPFENLSSDEEQAYFGDAMTDEIIMQLQKIKKFRVISRTSTLQYKDSKPTIPQIGEELNVNFLVEGTVQRQGKHIRIRVQVIRAKNEDHMWSDTYDKEWKDIFDIQSNVAKQIAHELKTILSPEEIEQIEKKPTENLEAYDSYLLGRFYWNKRTEEGLKKSIEYFEQAIEINSNYALAYAGLADAYVVLAFWGYLPSQKAYLKAKEIALEAIEIDNNLAEAHASLGAIAHTFERKWQDAEKEFKRAIELNPNYTTARQWYAELLACTGQFKEAFVQIKKALELDPLSMITNYCNGWIYYYARQYDDAIIKHQKALEIDKNFIPSHTYIFWSYLHQGMDIEAIEKLQEIMSMDTLTVKYVKVVGDIYEKSGIEGVLHLLIDLELTGATPNAISLSRYYAMLGEKEQAFGWLDKHYERGPEGWEYLKIDPALDNLRTDPRFIELLKKMGLDK